MDRQIKVVLVSLLMIAGCGGAQPSSADGGGGGGNSAQGAGTVVNAACDPASPPALLDSQLMVPCPEITTKAPDILLKQGNLVYRMVPVNGGYSYTYLSSGDYSTNDGRGCNFHVNLDGSIKSI